MHEFKEMTVGMIIGYIVAYDNERLADYEKENTIRQASQADFNRF